MRKAISFLFLIYFLSLCFVFAVPESDSNGYWISKPSDNKLTVIGVSNPMMRREDALAGIIAHELAHIMLKHGKLTPLTSFTVSAF